MAYTTINKSTDYFNTVLYSGTGSSQAITGVGFQPDWIWFKCRSQNQNHNLFDVIRGSNKIIQTSTSNAEATSTALLTSFDSDGFTVNTDGGVNGSSQTYASWNWLGANGTASNSDGSITSTVSANISAGFSIIKYIGQNSVGTIGHGLNSIPKMLIFKDLGSQDWYVHHTSLGVNGRLILNGTNAVADNTSFLNQVLPTSTLITLGTTAQVNASGNNYICYAFAENASKLFKIGSYVGNGSSDGNFIYTGGKPVWLMVKRTTDGSESWHIFDNKRNNFNEVNTRIQANSNGAEDTAAPLGDFVSNGFKIRGTGGGINVSGKNFIYMAIQQPIVGQNNVPCTAR